jgi:polyphosphate kinase 2 (PPK2 family)
MLENADLALRMEGEEYALNLKRFQAAMRTLAHQVYIQQRPVIILFEGWTAAGKGGAIRCITEKLDPRGYVVYTIDTPAGDEATHHYLKRYWSRLPETGQIAIFDRSWYGRVLGDRIEGFCTDVEWKRAYREINQFERQLIDFGSVLLKFWLHIDKEEQLRRFEEQAKDPFVNRKITPEDWRSHEKWDLYHEAVNDMLLKTSTVSASWTVVEANSKGYARVKILKTLVDKLSQELSFDPFSKNHSSNKNREGKKIKNRGN